MGNIHDDASDGTLTADLLQSYLLFDPSTIDTPGGRGSLTPLAAACRGGHLNVVRVLLDHKPNGAKPNALSINNRTPLFYATSHSPPKDRSAIVRALLDAGADVDFRFSYDGGNTPLMNAITEVRDKDVVHELVDHGASLTATNDQGETAETLAKRFGIEQELLPKDKRHSTLGAIIDLIVAIVMLVIAYTNNGQIKDAVNGAVKKLYDITGQMPADNTITTVPSPCFWSHLRGTNLQRPAYSRT
jgi:Ankyrin repeats (3 copies)/Ankyrin repeat